MRNRCVANWALKVCVSVWIASTPGRDGARPVSTFFVRRCAPAALSGEPLLHYQGRPCCIIRGAPAALSGAPLLHYQGNPCCTDRGGVHTALLWIYPLHYCEYSHCITGHTPTALLGICPLHYWGRPAMSSGLKAARDTGRDGARPVSTLCTIILYSSILHKR
jgi:hypothetical protein